MKQTYYIERIEGTLLDITTVAELRHGGMFVPSEIVVRCRNRAGTFDMLWTDTEPPRIGQPVTIEIAVGDPHPVGIVTSVSLKNPGD